MKLRSQSVVLFTTVLLGVSACLAGCATTGMNKATKTTNSIQTDVTEMARGEIKTGCATGCDLK